MSQMAKHRMRALAVASVLATVGIGVLVYAGWGAQAAWVRAALVNPVGVRSLLWILGGFIALGVLVAVMMHLRPEKLHGHPRVFHADQDGTAAIEFTLVLPFALMVLLIVTQAALLFNANMVVNYAGYCAGREACVALSMDLPNEGGMHCLVNNTEYPLSGLSTKLELIHRAAAMAVIPVSGELDQPPTDSSGNDIVASDYPDPSGQGIAARTQAAFNSMGKDTRPWLRRVQKKYNYALQYTQITLAQPEHWRDGNPDPDCPYRNSKQLFDNTQWTPENGYPQLPFCPHFPAQMDYYKWEMLHVRTVYQFLLDVPYAGRFMGNPVSIPGYQGQAYQAEIRITDHVMNEGGPDPKPH